MYIYFTFSDIVCDPDSHFECWDGKCIPYYYVCDGDNDCSKAEDEYDCSTANSTASTIGTTAEGLYYASQLRVFFITHLKLVNFTFLISLLFLGIIMIVNHFCTNLNNYLGSLLKSNLIFRVSDSLTVIHRNNLI